jgi:tetratricopeptide (TPR) repeat protein
VEQRQATTRIMLCMIVKNEAAILARCLESALPIISAACICDTGSDDATVETARELLGEAGIPYRLPEHEWVNFGTNRTRAFVAAQQFARELGWNLERTYALFLDADMLLDFEPEFDPDALTANGYLLLQQDGTMQYDNLRLARLVLDWRSVGVTHEYWTAEDAGDLPRLDTLAIYHLGDGGSKADKFERDIRLLKAELVNGQNLRTLFYLARSNEDTRQFKEARRHYDWRASAAGWEEEAWYAAYRQGLCSIELGDWEQGIAQLLRAWARRPQRAEPLYQLARHARLRGETHLAMLAAERALRIPPPADDRLFVEMPAYTYGPLEEVAISGFYTGDLDLGRDAVDTLLHDRDVPSHTREGAARNSSFYSCPLPVAWSVPIQMTEELDLPNYTPSNATICRTDDGYLMLVRLINYEQERGTHFYSREADGRIRSMNLHIWFDRDFTILSSAEIDESLLERTQPYATTSWVQGIEDPRLVRWREGWWFVANSRVIDPRGNPLTLLGRLDDEAMEVTFLTPLTYANSREVEKNWLPFVHEDRLLLVYASDPMIVLEPDLDSGRCREVHVEDSSFNVDRYRGSAPPMPYRNGYLYTIHEASYLDNRRIYLHRFVEMDRQFQITRVSRLFHVWHTGVEFNCGMCLNHAGDALLLTFSYEEEQSWLLNVPLAEVERMLLPVDALMGPDGINEDQHHSAGVAARHQ